MLRGGLNAADQMQVGWQHLQPEAVVLHPCQLFMHSPPTGRMVNSNATLVRLAPAPQLSCRRSAARTTQQRSAAQHGNRRSAPRHRS